MCAEMTKGEGMQVNFFRSLYSTYEELTCANDCRADIRVTSATYTIDRTENLEIPIALDSNFLTVGALTIPSGSILKPGTTKANLEIRVVADSRVRDAVNKIKPSRSKLQGEYKTHAQTVLSPAFECVSGDGVTEPFPVPIIYTAYLDQFAVSVDDELEQGYNYDDVCFARLYEITEQVDVGRYFKYLAWDCLLDDEDRLDNPVRASDSTQPPGFVSFTLTNCTAGPESMGVDGAVYAFIFAPIEYNDEDDTFFDWIESNFILFVLICIMTGFGLFAIIFGCGRLYRYRNKYHDARKNVDSIRQDVVLMEQYGGKAGTKDTEVIMIDNPMVLQLKDTKELSLEELELQERQTELRKARQDERDMQLEILKQQRNKLAEDVKQLQLAYAASVQKHNSVNRSSRVGEAANSLPAFKQFSQAQDSSSDSDTGAAITFDDDSD
jgi:hypothetical protein